MVIREGHYSGIEIGYCHMEKKADLSALGPYGLLLPDQNRTGRRRIGPAGSHF